MVTSEFDTPVPASRFPGGRWWFAQAHRQPSGAIPFSARLAVAVKQELSEGEPVERTGPGGERYQAVTAVVCERTLEVAVTHVNEHLEARGYPRVAVEFTGWGERSVAYSPQDDTLRVDSAGRSPEVPVNSVHALVGAVLGAAEEAVAARRMVAWALSQDALGTFGDPLTVRGVGLFDARLVEGMRLARPVALAEEGPEGFLESGRKLYTSRVADIKRILEDPDAPLLEGSGPTALEEALRAAGALGPEAVVAEVARQELVAVRSVVEEFNLRPPARPPEDLAVFGSSLDVLGPILLAGAGLRGHGLDVLVGPRDRPREPGSEAAGRPRESGTGQAQLVRQHREPVSHDMVAVQLERLGGLWEAGTDRDVLREEYKGLLEIRLAAAQADYAQAVHNALTAPARQVGRHSVQAYTRAAGVPESGLLHAAPLPMTDRPQVRLAPKFHNELLQHVLPRPDHPEDPPGGEPYLERYVRDMRALVRSRLRPPSGVRNPRVTAMSLPAGGGAEVARASFDHLNDHLQSLGYPGIRNFSLLERAEGEPRKGSYDAGTDTITLSPQGNIFRDPCSYHGAMGIIDTGPHEFTHSLQARQAALYAAHMLQNPDTGKVRDALSFSPGSFDRRLAEWAADRCRSGPPVLDAVLESGRGIYESTYLPLKKAAGSLVPPEVGYLPIGNHLLDPGVRANVINRMSISELRAVRAMVVDFGTSVPHRPPDRRTALRSEMDDVRPELRPGIRTEQSLELLAELYGELERKYRERGTGPEYEQAFKDFLQARHQIAVNDRSQAYQNYVTAPASEDHAHYTQTLVRIAAGTAGGVGADASGNRLAGQGRVTGVLRPSTVETPAERAAARHQGRSSAGSRGMRN